MQTNYKFLVIEDDESVIYVLKRGLEGCGLVRCEVISTSFLHAGIGILQNNGIDVVILDVQLPDDEGMEVSIKKIRDANQSVGIYVLSGALELKEAIRAMKHRADECREKPPEPFQRFLWSLVLCAARRKQVVADIEEAKREKDIEWTQKWETARAEYDAEWQEREVKLLTQFTQRETELIERIETLSHPRRHWYKRWRVWLAIGTGIATAIAALIKALN